MGTGNPTHQRLREHAIRKREELLASHDIVAMALSNPKEVITKKRWREALLGRPLFIIDEGAMYKRVTNNPSSAGLSDRLLRYATRPGVGNMPALVDAWKLVYCDLQWVDEDTSFNDAYKVQLREEEMQTRAERARELVRTEEEKMARRNAKWFIPVLERMTAEELAELELQDNGATRTIWKQISPAPPAWIQHIVSAQKPWGFAFYKSKEVERKFGDNWAYTWDLICKLGYYAPSDVMEGRDIVHGILTSIHCRGDATILNELWTTSLIEGPLAEDVNAEEPRRHFKEHRESLSSSGILGNTFIVLDDACIQEEGMRCMSRDYIWAWAHDADWEPSESDITSDGDRYQGRVKVPLFCLKAWFYAARWEGVSLKDMWLKARKHPRGLWICLSKEMEEWDHESFV